MGMRCKDCGNTELFTVLVQEYRIWIVDTEGAFSEDGGTYAKADVGHGFKCDDCESDNIDKGK